MNGEPQQFRNRLAEALREEILAAVALQSALADERAAVGGFDSEGLRLATETKQQCVSALQVASVSRLDLMRGEGFGVDARGIQDCLARLSPCPELNELFTRLGGLARACRDGNRLAGRMINRRAQVIAGALDSLGVPAPWRHASSYDGDGKSLGADSRRRFGHA